MPLIYDKEIKFQGNDAKELEFTSAIGGINPRIIFVQRNNFTLSISFTPIEILNQILSTFKFIEPADISDWKVYRNEEYGFEVKYPKYWHEQQPTKGIILELITEFLPEGGTRGFSDRLTIGVEENVKKLTLEELVDLEKTNFGYIFGIEKYSSFNGYESFEGRIDNMGMSTLYKVLIIKDDQIFDI